MIFSSIPFLYYFLPCVLLFYYLVPMKYKNGVLLLASLVFYAWGEPSYAFLMLVTILVGYVSGYWIYKFQCQNQWKWAKISLILGVGFCVGSLGFFKYAGFFVENVNRLPGIDLPMLKIALPVGISFYTFQILSYLIDVYRKDVPVQRNIISFGTYVTMFPQLIAGPIVRYGDIVKELQQRRFKLDEISLGIRRFLFGLGKKLLIANQLGELCEIFWNSQGKSILFYWIYAVAVSLQIYFDFSGYSDMAIGLGKLLGFSFPENFNYPFISGSITEFWRRWHMTLGTWFRDYVYIPLGGNRVKKSRWYLNIFLVWLLTGLWHGAAWNFVLWGIYFAVLLLIEKQWLLKHLEKAKVWNHIYVLLAVMFSFVLFDAVDLRAFGETIGCMFGMTLGTIASGKMLPFTSTETLYYLKSYGIVLLIACIGATPVVKRMIAWISGVSKMECDKIENLNKGLLLVSLLEPIVLAVILLLCTAYVVDGSFDPFLYFRF